MSLLKRELIAANDAYYRAFEAADPAAMDAVWSGGPDDVCVHPGWDVCAGPINVRNSYRRIFATGERLRVRLGAVHLDIHGEVGRITAVEHVYVPELKAIVGRVACTNLFLRVDGAWKMILHHGSPIHTPDPGDVVTMDEEEYN